MLAPLFALSALGFSSPDSKVGPALKLRGGGVSTDALYKSTAYLNALVGLQGFLAPKSTIEMYGPTDLSEPETFQLRALSGVQVMAGVTMFAGEYDVSKATSAAWIGWALATCANIPMLEKVGAKKEPIVATVSIFLALGELTRLGKLDEGLSSKILAALLIPLSAFEIFDQDAVLKPFGMPESSPLSKSLFENFSFTKMATGLLLLTSKTTGKKSLGLAAAAGATLANCVKTITRADKVGLKKSGLAVWAVLQGAIALLALKNKD
jgi:hypothetical protein